MTYTKKQLPKYCQHKPTGRAFVRIDGKMFYLGKYGSEASRREYDRIIAEFIANGRQPLHKAGEVLIEQLIIQFLDYVVNERSYSVTAESRLRRVLRSLNDLYGKQPVSSFNAMSLKTMRRQFLESGLSRETINAYVFVLKQVFHWGSDEREIVPPEVVAAIRTVPALKPGKTTAVEYAEIQPVDDAIVEKTLPYLSQEKQDMVRLQRLICGRPQDVLNMRVCDIDRSGEIWKYTPVTHKTKSRGKIRILPIGPRAQKILLPYLDKYKNVADQFIFQQNNVCKAGQSYAVAIESACKKAGVPKWTPNQLRHAGGTEVRDKFGLDYCQAILGHSNASTSEIYAKVSFEKAAEVAKKIG